MPGFVCARRSIVAAGIISLGLGASAHGADPWADHAVSYTPGAGANPSYASPSTAIGSPERFTGEGIFPSAVTPFSSPYGTDEVVSIGVGGSLVLGFDEPVANDALNPFGADLIVFTNAFFVDDNYPNGLAAGLFGGVPAVEVSADGAAWHAVAAQAMSGHFPTLGYLDLADPYSPTPGAVPSDFTRPVDPSFNPIGSTFSQIVAGYSGSGGGISYDIGPTGLASISFVRISNPSGPALAIDGVSDVTPVPMPGSLGLVAGGWWWARRGRRGGSEWRGRARVGGGAMVAA